jgi:dihydroorotase
MKILLKNVNLLHPAEGIDIKTSLLIEDGIIKKNGDITKEDAEEAKIYELEGKYCVPGLFDMHVHLREPGREDEETVLTGCNAAAAGGFTGLACMPNTNPAIDSAEVINLIKEKAKGHVVEVYPVGAVTKERKGESLAPIAELHEAGVVALSDDGCAVKTAALLRMAMEYANMYCLPILEHCEEPSMQGGAMNEGSTSTLLGLPPVPSIAEEIIVSRDIIVAGYTGASLHISHISTKNSIEMVRDAKKKGLKITAEAAPHHFSLTEETLKNYDTNYKMNPPLRTRQDVDAVIEGLKDGTIDCIASDHAPHASEEKDAEFIYAPNGILGLETELGLSISELVKRNHLSIKQLVEKLSINPRKILHIPVPSFMTGQTANMTIIDPDLIWTVDVKNFRSKSKNSPFDKKLLTGKSVAVINNGKMFVDKELFEI